jgi:excisionase family DNA binding protein
VTKTPYPISAQILDDHKYNLFKSVSKPIDRRQGHPSASNCSVPLPEIVDEREVAGERGPWPLARRSRGQPASFLLTPCAEFGRIVEAILPPVTLNPFRMDLDPPPDGPEVSRLASTSGKPRYICGRQNRFSFKLFDCWLAFSSHEKVKCKALLVDSRALCMKPQIQTKIGSSESLLSRKEAAQRLGISLRNFVYKMEAGAFPFVRLGRLYKFIPRDIEAYIQKHRRVGGRK